MPIHRMTVGAVLTPLGAQLKQPDANGNQVAVDLTNKTVKFFMTDEDGVAVITETATGVSVVTALTGLVQYQFLAEDIDVGTFYAWFVVYGISGEFDVFPSEGESYKVIVSEVVVVVSP